MELIYTDKNVVVCVKPAGVLSQEGPGNNMPALLREALCRDEVYPVHRLDTAAAGLMVFALTRAAAASLSAQVADKKLRKEYFAAMHGAPAEPAGAYEDLLFRDVKKNKTYVVDRPRKGVKQARLTYRTLCAAETPCGRGSLVRVRLETGRTHQIRVQFASRGTPLFGDGKYGAKDNEPALALLSCALGFTLPDTGKEVSFELPLPRDGIWAYFTAE